MYRAFNRSQTKSNRTMYEVKSSQSISETTSMELQPQLPVLNRLSEQEEYDEDDDDDEGDYDDNIEEGCVDHVMDNVSKNTTSTTFACYPSSSLGDSKLKAYSCDTDDSATYSNPLRKRNTAKSTNTKSTKPKCVHFMTSSSHSSAEMNDVHSKPLKKIVFNGTFPIDVPYSSRF